MGDRELPGLVREARLRAGLTQEELAEAVGVSRESIHALERDRPKRPIDAPLANGLAKALPFLTVLRIVSALGYDVGIEELDEEEVVVAHAYRLAGAETRRLVRLALELEPILPSDGPDKSLRRLAAKDHPDRQETLE